MKMVISVFTICLFAMFVLPMIVFAQTTPVDPTQIIELIVGSATSYGVLGGVAAFLSVVVSIFAYFAPGPWSKISDMWRFIIAFCVTGVGTGGMAFLAGGTLVGAIGAGITGGFAAVGFNQAIKKGVEVVKKPDPFVG